MGSGNSTASKKVQVAPAGTMTGAKLSPVDRLSDAQLEEFQEAFNMFDKDGGGSIDAKELKELMASVGQAPSDAELAEMIAAADADGTGDIDFTELRLALAQLGPLERREDPGPVERDEQQPLAQRLPLALVLRLLLLLVQLAKARQLVDAAQVAEVGVAHEGDHAVALREVAANRAEPGCRRLGRAAVDAARLEPQRHGRKGPWP